MDGPSYFLRPSQLERLMNKSVGWLARLGLGPKYIHLLQVRGRRTGKIYSTPVNLLEFQDGRYLVGGRGHTGWSKNAEAVGTVTLLRGRHSRQFRVTPVAGEQKLEVLKAYVDEYPRTVERFFGVRAGSPVTAYRPIADRHPVFEVRE